MVIEQLYTGCLAQGAYYIESMGEVAIIDPLREVQQYADKANKAGAKIKYIFETHFHADFISGHVNLANETGATIIYGPNAVTAYNSYSAKDGEIFTLGDIKIKAIHTPGHTLESTTYLVIDKNGKDHALFTGDTLFLGDVGRPDLAQKSDLTQQQLAAMLYDSLRNKIMNLSDDIIVYPAHGAGSACGKNMMKQTVDTLGNQKQMNYALRSDMNKADFIEEVLDGLSEPPEYFPLNVSMNKNGYTDPVTIFNNANKALDPAELETLANQTSAIVLDTRAAQDYAAGHIPNSIFIGIDGGFAPWVGTVLKDVQLPLILVVEDGRLEEVVTRLGRVGFDNILGYLNNGITSWSEAGKDLSRVNTIPATQLEKELSDTIYENIIDVRKAGEYDASHIENAQLIPLSTIYKNYEALPDKEFYVHCAGGYRSMIAASLLKRNGIHNFKEIAGGYNKIRETKLNLVSD